MTPTPDSGRTSTSTSTFVVGVGVTLLAIILIAAFSWWGVNAQSQLVERIYRHPFTVSTNVLEADKSLIAMHRYMKDVVIARDEQALNVAIGLVSENEQRVLSHLETAKREFLGDPDRFQSVIDAVVSWREIRSEVIALTREGEYDRAADITINKGADYVAFLNTEMSGLVDFARDKAAEFREESRRQKQQVEWAQGLVFFFVVAMVLLIFSMMFRMTRRSEQGIRNSEYRFRSIYTNAPLSVWDEDYTEVFSALENLRASGVTDLRTHLEANPEIAPSLAEKVIVRSVNPASVELFSADSEEVLIGSIAKTFGEGAMEVFVDSICAVWAGDTVFNAKANYVGLTGRRITAQVSIPLPQDMREAAYVPVVIKDVTQQEQMEGQLKRLASVFTEADEGICIVSPDMRIIEVNEAFTAITGYDRADVLDENPRILQSGRHDADFYEAMWAALNDQDNWRGEIWNRRKDGTVYPQILTISTVRGEDDQIENYVGLFSDISEIKEHEEQLEHLARYDTLTGLPNRLMFSDRLEQAMLNAERDGSTLAVVYIDLDGFKAVNDTYGHDAGDALLVAVAGRMEASVRKVDSLARIGGDEFVALFANAEEAKFLVTMLNRLLERLAEPYVLDQVEVSVSASIGVSLYTQYNKVEGDQLQRQADQAMYEAKLSGKNNWRIFDPDQETAISQRFQLLSEIDRAIQNNEFEVHYQPKANLVTGEVIGAEALLRWHHPERGMLFPDQFLPQIENENISIDVGEWVIRSVLAQLAEWVTIGLNLPVSVNVGAVQLQSPDFVDRLEQDLAKHPSVLPSLLELEILETSALSDFTSAAEVVRRGNALGIEFALDDFGSGYSSLIYLKKLRVKTLKIDQEFVRSMLSNPDDETILKGVLGLAENFKMIALAEGVETDAHVSVLRRLGCVYGQGYAISKPLNAAAFRDWLTDGGVAVVEGAAAGERAENPVA